jgi:8-oxo-dGTP pyrophosphatase MutT (NUDIX family)
MIRGGGLYSTDFAPNEPGRFAPGEEARMSEGRIRAVALAIFVRPRDGAVLAIRFDDRGRIFYRPPGGGVEFGETSCEAACREALEELGEAVVAERLLGVVENIYTHDDRQGHQIMFNWLLHFVDASLYARDEFPVLEANGKAFTAYWVHDAQLQAQGTQLYPRELAGQLAALT